MEEKIIECNLVAKHFVFDSKDGQHFDYWQKYVRIGKFDVPIKLDKKDKMARAFVHEKLGIE